MEKITRAVKQIAYTPPSQRLSRLSAQQISLIPLLSLTSSLYSVALRLRHQLYRFNVLSKYRLPVPVISVGNLTWGGNGKTPMVEFLARSFAGGGISPLILTWGYSGADEAKMLKRQLERTSVYPIGQETWFRDLSTFEPNNGLTWQMTKRRGIQKRNQAGVVIHICLHVQRKYYL